MRERKRLSLGFMVMTLVSAAIFGGGATAPATEPAMPAHLRAALEIATQIKAADNEYAHADCFIHWKGVDGADKFANRTDCSDFFNLLLEHSYSYTSKDFKAWTGATRPTATLWYDAAEKGTAKGILSPLKKVSDLLPGDLIFIKYPPGEADTGHVMLVAAAAKARAASEPVETGTRQWEIGVVDSSKSGHGTTDTRHNADGTYSQGVGKGIWRLYTKDDGTPAGYAWSTLKASKFVPVSEHAVILARLSVVKG